MEGHSVLAIELFELVSILAVKHPSIGHGSVYIQQDEFDMFGLNFSMLQFEVANQQMIDGKSQGFGNADEAIVVSFLFAFFKFGEGIFPDVQQLGKTMRTHSSLIT